MSGTVRVAVVSDIHANPWALERAFALLDERGFDRLIVLGDLLTYGPAVDDTLALLRSREAEFLVGNHDQLYFDLDAGELGYFNEMPAWIKESARATHAQLSSRPLAQMFAWQHEIVVDGVLFTHANPYGAGDWSYVSTAAAAARAAAAVEARGLRAAVVGHTHRVRHSGRVLNPGSVGQPRDEDKAASCGIVSIARDRVELDVVPVEYDVSAYVEATKRGPLPASAQAEVLRYMGAA